MVQSEDQETRLLETVKASDLTHGHTASRSVINSRLNEIGPPKGKSKEEGQLTKERIRIDLNARFFRFKMFPWGAITRGVFSQALSSPLTYPLPCSQKFLRKCVMHLQGHSGGGALGAPWAGQEYVLSGLSPG